MGMVHWQNKALTLKLILGICSKAKRFWGLARLDTKRMEMEDAVCFMLIAFGAGLWGKEVPLVSLEGLLNFRRVTQEGEMDERNMMITLSVHFKGKVCSQWHKVPISNKTHSDIQFCLWMERIMLRRVNYQHHTKGWLFKMRTGARAKFRRYDTTLQSLVALAWATYSQLILDAIELDDFSIWRLLRRGAVLKMTLTPRRWS
jgi:hypothetical protein